MQKLNVIGAGRVGRTLAALFERTKVFEVQAVASRTAASARDAVGFIGAGFASDSVAAMPPAEVWLIATPDRAIASTCEVLAGSAMLRPGDVVFHCSGVLSSLELAAAAACSAAVASVHPLKSFATPAEAVPTFAGTPCVAEGDGAALDVLEPAFERLGARVLHVDRASKALYHAASVIVCNYLVALLDTGLRTYERAGIPRDSAAALIEPIVRETIDHVFRAGTAGALTGPVSRGDDATVARHLHALRAWEPQVAALYAALGVATIDVARAQGLAEDEALERIAAILKR